MENLVLGAHSVPGSMLGAKGRAGRRDRNGFFLPWDNHGTSTGMMTLLQVKIAKIIAIRYTLMLEKTTKSKTRQSI